MIENVGEESSTFSLILSVKVKDLPRPIERLIVPGPVTCRSGLSDGVSLSEKEVVKEFADIFVVID